ncbi:hypothetical protein NCS55_01451700 [Fusarium keratoplasticum]|nr:hypothetical protein NCS55_01451700 [Fusarium keratoplasticum]
MGKSRVIVVKNMIRAATMPAALAGVVASRALGKLRGNHQVQEPFGNVQMTMILGMAMVIYLKPTMSWSKTYIRSFVNNNNNSNNRSSSCKHNQTRTRKRHHAGLQIMTQ